MNQTSKDPRIEKSFYFRDFDIFQNFDKHAVFIGNFLRESLSFLGEKSLSKSDRCYHISYLRLISRSINNNKCSF